MSEGVEAVAEKISSSISFLEKLSQVRALILLLSFCFYTDIWLIAFNKDPAKLSLSSGLADAKDVAFQTAAIFILLYSLLMGIISPFMRKLVIAVRLLIEQKLELIEVNSDERLLIDWSFTVVVLVISDAIIGWRAAPHAYSGFALFIVNFLSPDNYLINAARVCIGLCFLACLFVAFRADR